MGDYVHFYNVQTKPKFDLLLVLGDLNAKTGKEASVSNVAGKYTQHTYITRDNGQFATSHNMIIGNTYSDH